mgnify:CR=1 FL=1
MIQTSFFPQPEKDKPIKIIQINSSGLQPRKVEELLPNLDILPDTYMIYPNGGYHPFYGVPNTPPRYQLPIWPCVVRIKYSESETVATLEEVKHDIARACMVKNKINNAIEITSMADIPAGSGLGSSSTYTVGLLNALHTMNRDYLTLQELAEEACFIEIDELLKPMGKQDQYIAVYGGFTTLEIARDGSVSVNKANINYNTIDDLRRNLIMFYTGKQRTNKKILSEQTKATEKDESYAFSLIAKHRDIVPKYVDERNGHLSIK